MGPSGTLASPDSNVKKLAYFFFAFICYRSPYFDGFFKSLDFRIFECNVITNSKMDFPISVEGISVLLFEIDANISFGSSLLR